MKQSTKKYAKPTKKVNKKRAQTKKTLLEQKLEMINPNAAGIDVASEEMWVCVPEDRADVNVRQFGAFTCDLYAIADWLAECGVTSVAMESTGVYWIPLYQVLEHRGFQVCLVNARHLKNVSNRPKTDRLDCQWIQRLHSYGLLMPSFRPNEAICQIRSVQRHRENLIRQASRHIQHMQKSLHQMNLLLDKVVSDMTGVTGLAIIQKMLDGERKPAKLATVRDPRCRSSEEEIAKALEGDYREEHLFVLRQAFNSYHFAQRQIRECDRKIEELLRALDKQIDATQTPLAPATTPRKSPRDNEFRFEGADTARTLAYEGFGVDLTQIPGLQATSALILLSEIGADLSAWKTDKQFTSWLGLSPNTKASGGKTISSATRKVNSRVARVFRQSAQALSRSKSYLGAYYRRIRARIGGPKAVTAAARKLAGIFYKMVTTGTAYRELGETYYLKANTQRQLRKLKHHAKLLGFELVPNTQEA